MTQSYLAQGLKQSRFLFELHTRESGKQSCCGNFRTFSLITRIHSSEASKWARCFYASRSSAPVELIWNYAFPARSFALLDDHLSRKRLFTINESLLANFGNRGNRWQLFEIWTHPPNTRSKQQPFVPFRRRWKILSPFPTFEIELIEIHWRTITNFPNERKQNESTRQKFG